MRGGLASRVMWAVAAAALAAGGVAAWAQSVPTPRVVLVSAMKFEFDPATITLRKGEPVVLVFTSLDRTHGFSVPDLGVKATILPDTELRVAFTPERAGRFVFHCDNFCGDGHEDMQGVIVVES
jgi:cytochrome c oxidase subunit II